jgi:hypothetical protein
VTTRGIVRSARIRETERRTQIGQKETINGLKEIVNGQKEIVKRTQSELIMTIIDEEIDEMVIVIKATVSRATIVTKRRKVQRNLVTIVSLKMFVSYSTVAVQVELCPWCRKMVINQEIEKTKEQGNISTYIWYKYISHATVT